MLKKHPFWPIVLEDDFLDHNFHKQTGLSVYEDKDHIYVEAALPGLDPDQIEVSFEKDTLWIKGEKKEEKEDKEKKYYRKASSSFSYCISVPGQVDHKKEPEAKYKHGVMKVTFSKSETTSPKKIKVKHG